MWIIGGIEKSGGQELTIAFAGCEVNKNYIVSLAFDSPEREDYLGKKWLWKIPKIIKENKKICPLLVVQVPSCFSSLSEKIKCLYIPCYVSGEIDISVDGPTLFKNRNTSLKSDISKIKKNKLNFEVTKDLSQLHNFHYNMLIPQALARYGNKAIIPNYEPMEKEFIKHSQLYDLLLVKNQQEYISGILLRYKNKNIAKLCHLGVKDGNIDYVRDGAIGALFYFSFHHVSEKGCKKIDFGDSRPFLKDGVLKYKEKWNYKISNKNKTGFFVKPLSKTDGVKNFFLNNPFVYEDKKELCGAIFVTNDCPFDKEDFAKICKEYYINGLSKLVIYRFGKTDSGISITIPPEYSDKITFCSTDSIF